jgi:hypothetical protein
VVGMVFGADVDWTEVAELLTESFCARAPRANREGGRILGCSPRLSRVSP